MDERPNDAQRASFSSGAWILFASILLSFGITSVVGFISPFLARMLAFSSPEASRSFIKHLLAVNALVHALLMTPILLGVWRMSRPAREARSPMMRRFGLVALLLAGAFLAVTWVRCVRRFLQADLPSPLPLLAILQLVTQVAMLLGVLALAYWFSRPRARGAATWAITAAGLLIADTLLTAFTPRDAPEGFFIMNLVVSALQFMSFAVALAVAARAARRG